MIHQNSTNTVYFWFAKIKSYLESYIICDCIFSDFYRSIILCICSIYTYHNFRFHRCNRGSTHSKINFIIQKPWFHLSLRSVFFMLSLCSVIFINIKWVLFKYLWPVLIYYKDNFRLLTDWRRYIIIYWTLKCNNLCFGTKK